MIAIQEIRRKYGGLICRRCINAAYGVRLMPSDCLYESETPSYCVCCDGTHHLVSGFRARGKLKVLFKK